MRKLDVEARYDDTHPEGGHAVALFAGLEAPTVPVRFVLRPLDAHVDPDRLEELAEPQEAVACRDVPGGCEIVFGPQTTAHPALETGTVVEIELVDLNVGGEIIWPAVMPLARPRRSSLQIKKVGGSKTPAASGADMATARELPRLQPIMIRGGAATASQTASAAARLPQPSLVSYPVQEEPVVKRAPDGPPPQTAGDATTAPTDIKPAQHDAAPHAVFYPHARGGHMNNSAGHGSRQRASLLPSSPGGAALSTAIVMMGLVGLYSMATTSPRPIAISAVSQSAPAPAPNTPARPVNEPAVDLSLFDLLSPGPTSPRGLSAKDVSPQKALELAQTAFFVAGSQQRDPEEGAFWLRRYLATIGADERARRALTQLGSAYADSFNKTFDLGRAKQAWELASAFGDPVAMCFLGVVHENGLAGPVDKKQSLVWLERAKAAGGCPGLDEAIARVKS